MKLLEKFLIKTGLLAHKTAIYPGFAGVPGYMVCLRCGQPWKDLGVFLEVNAVCPGSKYKKTMRAKTEALWAERARGF